MFTHTGRAETFSDRADYQHQGNSHHTHQELGNTRSFDITATPFRPLSLLRCQMHAISRLPSLLPSRPLLPPNPHPNPSDPPSLPPRSLTNDPKISYLSSSWRRQVPRILCPIRVVQRRTRLGCCRRRCQSASVCPFCCSRRTSVEATVAQSVVENAERQCIR